MTTYCPLVSPLKCTALAVLVQAPAWFSVTPLEYVPSWEAFVSAATVPEVSFSRQRESTAVDAPVVIDRTLQTAHADANEALWRAAGYEEPPTVPAMVQELAEFDYRFADHDR